jgi:hypothetical protein
MQAQWIGIIVTQLINVQVSMVYQLSALCSHLLSASTMHGHYYDTMLNVRGCYAFGSIMFNGWSWFVIHTSAYTVICFLQAQCLCLIVTQCTLLNVHGCTFGWSEGSVGPLAPIRVMHTIYVACFIFLPCVILICYVCIMCLPSDWFCYTCISIFIYQLSIHVFFCVCAWIVLPITIFLCFCDLNLKMSDVILDDFSHMVLPFCLIPAK